MALEPGTTLGPYSVTAKIGEGGMGEVYRARDTKLDRDVALKVLPEAFTSDPDRLARFEREAKVLASLNHPNIGHIYGLEEAEGQRALVLELIEGPTLADRIAQGPIPVDEALPIAKQIAEALEAAHEAGVIHRDLKPANIKVKSDGTVKVLDFGLAKALDPSPTGDPSQSPTLTAAATQMGVIMGTAAYMSPEQARGKPVDKRADIWAFGAVLFEMLTGQRAFSGEDVSLTLSAILQRDPEWEGLPLNLGPSVRTLLERCLEKNPKDRWHEVADVRIDLQKILADPGGFLVDSVATRTPARPVRWIASTAVLVAALSAVATWILKPVEPRLISRVSVDLPTPRRPVAPIALSPDGRFLVYVVEDRLFLRPMEDAQATPIAGSEGGANPFFSPDGEWIAFFTQTQIKKVRATGGGMTVVAEFEQGLVGAWDSQDRILFGQGGPTGLFQVHANGGAVQPFAELGDYGDLDYPSFLPGGEWVLFTALVGDYAEWDDAEIVAQSFITGERKVLLEGGHYARYVSTGHLVYTRYGRLFAVGFDAERMETISDPVLLLDSVAASNRMSGTAVFAVADDAGTLAFASGGDRAHQLVVVNSDGAEETLELAPRAYTHPRVSPDGSQLAVQVDEDALSEIWVLDLSGDADIRLLPQEGSNRAPIWTPDSQRITFASNRDGAWGIYEQPADGSSGAELLTMADAESLYLPGSWSPDGAHLTFTAVSAGRRDIGIFDRDQEESSRLFENATGSQFSPDGKWVVYERAEGAFATTAIFIQAFPPDGVELRVVEPFSRGPKWSPDGRALLYGTWTGPLHRISIAAGDSVTSGNAEALPTRVSPRISTHRNFDTLPDGRILMVPEESSLTQINLVQNWFEELKERVPIP